MGVVTALFLLASLASIDVAVTTTGGATVEGKARLSTLKIKTDFGTATVKADRLASITFGDPDVVVTKGDYEIRGRVTLSSLRVETAGGPRTLKRKEIASLVVLEGGRRRGGTDFNGDWMLTHGNGQSRCRLRQRGRKVDGKYGHDGEFSLEGEVKGRTLKLKLREPGGTGEGEVELWQDGAILLGKVDFGGRELVLGGYRLRPRPAKPEPGKITQGQSKAGLIYFLRVPKSYDGQRRYPAIVITHGSNANARGYVETFPARWPELAKDYVIVGVNGERLSSGSRPGAVGHNASYINFSGPDRGPKFARRQTPALLAETVTELREQLPIEKVFLGGHSQGGFLTYATFLFFPDLFAGAFPMSCNLLVQCEPDNFENPESLYGVAVAPIHGQADNVVAFSGGEYCYRRMQEFGFPRLRFFAPRGAGHGFMYLPVEEAIRWLEQMTSDDPAALADFAEKRYAAGEYRDATGALLRARERDKPGALRSRLGALEEKIDAKAAPAAKKLEQAIRASRNNRWVDDFWEFRRQFAHTPAARACLDAYEKLKAKHAKPATELFYAARGERDERARKAKYREIYEKYYASGWWILVKDWVKK